jgi:hypothetical protein
MNLSRPVSSYTNTNRLPWLLAAVALISLSILLANIPYKLSFVSTNTPAATSTAHSTSQQGHGPQVMPVPTPSQNQLSPTPAPKMSATPMPAKAKPFPAVQPVATPPAGK